MFRTASKTKAATPARKSIVAEGKRAANKLLKSELRYRALFNAIDEGFCIIEVIFDENERPIDYRFLEVNPSFEKQTGLIGAQGKRMRELAPKHEEHWFEIYGKIAVTGQPARFVNRAEQLHRWFDVYAFRFGQPENRQVAILFNDITERQRVERELQHHIEDFELPAQGDVQVDAREQRGHTIVATFERTVAELSKFPDRLRGSGFASHGTFYSYRSQPLLASKSGPTE